MCRRAEALQIHRHSQSVLGADQQGTEMKPLLNELSWIKGQTRLDFSHKQLVKLINHIYYSFMCSVIAAINSRSLTGFSLFSLSLNEYDRKSQLVVSII